MKSLPDLWSVLLLAVREPEEFRMLAAAAVAVQPSLFKNRMIPNGIC